MSERMQKMNTIKEYLFDLYEIELFKSEMYQGRPSREAEAQTVMKNIQILDRLLNIIEEDCNE